MMLNRLLRRGHEPPQATVVEQEKVVEIPLENLLDKRELNSRMLKLSFLPFLADSRAVDELAKIYRVKLLLKAGFRSAYSMSRSLLERAYVPYPDEVWRLIPLAGYKGPVYVRDAYYVLVKIPGETFGDYFVKVEGEPLKPFCSEPDDIASFEGVELYEFRRGTVERIMEYVRGKADMYGVRLPRFKVLFDAYMADVNHGLRRWDGELASNGYLYIGYVDMVFKGCLYADGSHIEWKPYQKLSEDALKALLGPDAGEILLRRCLRIPGRRHPQ